MNKPKYIVEWNETFSFLKSERIVNRKQPVFTDEDKDNLIKRLTEQNKQYTISDYVQPASEKIAEFEKQLKDTDYQAIKFAEGWISEEDYKPIKAKRQEWRDEINKLTINKEDE